MIRPRDPTMTGTATSRATSDSLSSPSCPVLRNIGPSGLIRAHAQKFTAKPTVARASISHGEPCDSWAPTGPRSSCCVLLVVGSSNAPSGPCLARRRAACPPWRAACAQTGTNVPSGTAGRSRSATPHQQQSPGLRSARQVLHVEGARVPLLELRQQRAAGRAERPGRDPARAARRRGRRRSSRAGSRAGSPGRRAPGSRASVSPQLHACSSCRSCSAGVALVRRAPWPCRPAARACRRAGRPRRRRVRRPAAAGPARSPWPGGPRRRRVRARAARPPPPRRSAAASSSTRPSDDRCSAEHRLDQQPCLRSSLAAAGYIVASSASACGSSSLAAPGRPGRDERSSAAPADRARAGAARAPRPRAPARPPSRRGAARPPRRPPRRPRSRRSSVRSSSSPPRTGATPSVVPRHPIYYNHAPWKTMARTPRSAGARPPPGDARADRCPRRGRRSSRRCAPSPSRSPRRPWSSITGLHGNTVREHLEALVRARPGPARARRAERSRPARPGSTTPPPRRSASGVRRSRGRAGRVHRAHQPAPRRGRRRGRRGVGARARPRPRRRRPTTRWRPARPGRRAARRPRLRARARTRRTPPRVRLARCPLLEAAHRHPEVVCAVHLGIVRGALEEYGADPAGSRPRALRRARRLPASWCPPLDDGPVMAATRAPAASGRCATCRWSAGCWPRSWSALAHPFLPAPRWLLIHLRAARRGRPTRSWCGAATSPTPCCTPRRDPRDRAAAEPPAGAAQRGRAAGRRSASLTACWPVDRRRGRGRRPAPSAGTASPWSRQLRAALPARFGTHRALLRRRRGGCCPSALTLGAVLARGAGRAVAPAAAGRPRLGQPARLDRAHRPRAPWSPCGRRCCAPGSPPAPSGPPRRALPVLRRRRSSAGGGRRPRRASARSSRLGWPVYLGGIGRRWPRRSRRGARVRPPRSFPDLVRRRRARLADRLPGSRWSSASPRRRRGRRPDDRFGWLTPVPRRRLRRAGAARRAVLPRARRARRRARARCAPATAVLDRGAALPRRRRQRRRCWSACCRCRPPCGSLSSVVVLLALAVVPAAARPGAAGLAAR